MKLNVITKGMADAAEKIQENNEIIENELVTSFDGKVIEVPAKFDTGCKDWQGVSRIMIYEYQDYVVVNCHASLLSGTNIAPNKWNNQLNFPTLSVELSQFNLDTTGFGNDSVSDITYRCGAVGGKGVMANMQVSLKTGQVYLQVGTSVDSAQGNFSITIPKKKEVN